MPSSLASARNRSTSGPRMETAASCMRAAGSAPSMIGITTYPSRAPSGATASWAPAAAARRNSASIRSPLAAGSNFRGLNEQAATRTGVNMPPRYGGGRPPSKRPGPRGCAQFVSAAVVPMGVRPALRLGTASR